MDQEYDNLIELYQEGNNELLFLSFGHIKVGQESINNSKLYVPYYQKNPKSLMEF